MSAKTNMASKVLALAVILVVAALVYPAVTNTKGEKKARNVVHVVVSFLPAQRSEDPQQVVATLIVGGNSSGAVSLTKAPKTWSLHPLVGQTVVVHAAQAWGEGLGCAITQEGTTGSFQTIAGTGGVSCTHVTQ